MAEAQLPPHAVKISGGGFRLVSLTLEERRQRWRAEFIFVNASTSEIFQKSFVVSDEGKMAGWPKTKLFGPYKAKAEAIVAREIAQVPT